MWIDDKARFAESVESGFLLLTGCVIAVSVSCLVSKN